MRLIALFILIQFPFILFSQISLVNRDSALICLGDTLTLDSRPNTQSITWNNGSNLAQIKVWSPGLYFYQSMLGSQSVTDSIYIIPNQISYIPNSSDFNTANDGNGGKLTSGLDLKWEISKSGISGPYYPADVVTNPTSAWYNSPWPNAGWISGNPSGLHPSTGPNSGNSDFYFKCIFDLPCTSNCGNSMSDSGQFCLNIDFFADNYISEVWINGVGQFVKMGLPISSNGYNELGFISGGSRQVSLCSDFFSGRNEIIVELQSGPYAYGFLCQANVSLLAPQPITDTIIQFGCDSLVFNSSTFYTDTNFIDFALDSSGFCSESYIDLKIHSTTIDSLFINECDSFFWPLKNNIYKTSGVYYDSLKNSSGCDSITVLILSLFDSEKVFQAVSSCNVHVTSQGIIYNTNSTDTAYFVNNDGCDSIFILDVTINSSDSVHKVISNCSEYTWVNNQTYYTSTTDTALFVNQAGCDSIVILDLTIFQPDSSIQIISTCYPFTWINNQTYYSSSVDSITYQNIYGCDSTLYLDLTVLPTDTFQATITTCDSTITIAGVSYFQDTSNIVLTLSNQNGCDSSVIYDLVFHPSYITTDSAYTETFFYWNISNQSYSESGTFIYSSTTINDCDSIFILHLQTSLPNKCFMPNAFTPNSDNNNDLYGPKCHNAQDINFRIFSRWGELIYSEYSADSEIKGWDGQIEGKSIKSDIFLWILEVNFQNGQNIKRSGYVTLLL